MALYNTKIRKEGIFKTNKALLQVNKTITHGINRNNGINNNKKRQMPNNNNNNNNDNNKTIITFPIPFRPCG